MVAVVPLVVEDLVPVVRQEVFLALRGVVVIRVLQEVREEPVQPVLPVP